MGKFSYNSIRTKKISNQLFFRVKYFTRSGQGRTGQGRPGQARTVQGSAGQGRAGQGRAGRGRADQGRAGQGGAGHTCMHITYGDAQKRLLYSRLPCIQRNMVGSYRIGAGM